MKFCRAVASLAEDTMKKLILFGTALLVFATVPLHAQSGCVNSPENPTALLALAGSAGAVLASARNRFRRK